MEAITSCILPAGKSEQKSTGFAEAMCLKFWPVSADLQSEAISTTFLESSRAYELRTPKMLFFKATYGIFLID